MSLNTVRPSLLRPSRFALRISLRALAFLLFAVVRISAAEELVHRKLTVDGVEREALVHVPPTAKGTAAPVVFAFHGHGGSMNNAARSFSYHTQWPEAIVVYPQGLNTAGKLTDPEGKKAGWQNVAGTNGDRDLKFFDAMLENLQLNYKVDAKRIYSTGHSNGGGFTYLLWAVRGDRFAAVAPCAAAALKLHSQLQPKPVLHLAGEKDPLVKYEWQQTTMAALRKLNQCGEGQPWGTFCTLYPSKIGAPVVTYIHPGGHTFPSEAPATIVKFFKEHAKP